MLAIDTYKEYKMEQNMYEKDAAIDVSSMQ